MGLAHGTSAAPTARLTPLEISATAGRPPHSRQSCTRRKSCLGEATFGASFSRWPHPRTASPSSSPPTAHDELRSGSVFFVFFSRKPLLRPRDSYLRRSSVWQRPAEQSHQLHRRLLSRHRTRPTNIVTLFDPGDRYRLRPTPTSLRLLQNGHHCGPVQPSGLPEPGRV